MRTCAITAITKERLTELYHGRGLSTLKIAKHYDVDPTTVQKRMRQYKITYRSPSERQKLGYRKGYRRPYKGKDNPRWNGGVRISHGYRLIYLPEHCRASDNYVFEHILVWEQVHNHPLPKGWIIHHLNGIKLDNRPENLVAMPKAGHARREMGEYYKKRIREVEAKVKLLERTLDSQQLIFWSEN